MRGRVIQGFFVGGRLPSHLLAPRAAGAHAPAVQRQAAPVRPTLAHHPRGGAAQPHGLNGTFEIDPLQVEFARSGGQGLPAPLRSRMESAFGADFSGVRVHVGPQAARIGAIAFTTGTDIYFAPGRYQPDTIQGQQLIGHELTHVIQQRQGRVRNPPSGIAVVQDRALEAEADRLGMRAAAHRLPIQPKRREPPVLHNSVSRTVQRYRVLGPNKIYHNGIPDDRPQSGYPYAFVPAASRFGAQRIKGGGTGVDTYLKTGKTDKANVSKRNHKRLSLRVSNDGKMAIENSNLNRRQPKEFYATAEVIATSNGELDRSSISFQQHRETITILTRHSSDQTLFRVTPKFTKPPAQNCDALAGQVTGIGTNIRGRATWGLATGIASLLGRNPKTFELETDPTAYLKSAEQQPKHAAELGLNAAARPNVGEAFVIATTGPTACYVGNPDMAQALDMASGRIRNLAWSFHFGAVVARSGTDRITLENYARGDNRQANFDPRWYFQMYGEGRGQSFHEFHEAREEYANPATVSVK